MQDHNNRPSRLTRLLRWATWINAVECFRPEYRTTRYIARIWRAFRSPEAWLRYRRHEPFNASKQLRGGARGSRPAKRSTATWSAKPRITPADRRSREPGEHFSSTWSPFATRARDLRNTEASVAIMADLTPWVCQGYSAPNGQAPRNQTEDRA